MNMNKIKLVEKGRISIGKASELLKKTIYDLQEAAKKHGIQLGATQKQAKKSRETAKKIFLTS